ncbi:MAG: class I SAM-dependent methyltransferase [Actinomycetota bacterium]
MDRADHWDAIYRGKGPVQVSWYQRDPVVSEELIRPLHLPPDAAIIDVGGGASTLVDTLLQAGFQDVTVLDISSAALEAAQHRLGVAALRVTWLHQDLLDWEPQRRYGLWHDRAVFHFLAGSVERDRYRRVLIRALRDDAHAIVGTFAVDGPTRCSGLEVRRYSPQGICDEFGTSFDMIAARSEDHSTPAGISQSFSWAVMRRAAD